EQERLGVGEPAVDDPPGRVVIERPLPAARVEPARRVRLGPAGGLHDAVERDERVHCESHGEPFDPMTPGIPAAGAGSADPTPEHEISQWPPGPWRTPPRRDAETCAACAPTPTCTSIPTT